MVTNYILHSEVTGQGETIVLLHGYLSSSQYFKHIREPLSRHFRVITLDLLGFGRSPKPNVAYNYDDHMNAVQATLDALGVKKPFILLGHSMGALIALKYAATKPSDVTKLILFNPPLFTSREQMVSVHKSHARRYRVMLYSRGRHIYWLTLRLVPRRHTKRRPAINFTDIISMSPAAREGSYRNIIGGASVFNDFDTLKVPTLLVNGRYDRAVYLENLAGRMLPPGMTSVTIDTGHHPLVRNVEESLNLIRSYLLQ